MKRQRQRQDGSTGTFSLLTRDNIPGVETRRQARERVAVGAVMVGATSDELREVLAMLDLLKIDESSL